MSKLAWGENLDLKISMLPDSPGCYLMKDVNGTIIYVGKAVNLKNRVRSYFRDTEHTPKVAAMISHIADFDILLCDSNLEALCLECNLIKLHKPYYNILLKDDKHYPYICINLKEDFPRLTIARRIENNGAKYYGPYIGITAVKQVIDTVRNVFPMRNCKMELPCSKPVRPCIQYDMKRCLAPCAGMCTAAEYWDMMDGVLSFLDGNYKQVVDLLKKEMIEASEHMEYEHAAQLRDQIRSVEGILERQLTIQTDKAEQDIIAISQDGIDAMIQILYVRGGRMVGGDHHLLCGEGGENKGDVIAEFMMAYYQEGNLIPRNVLVSTLPEGGLEQMEEWLRKQKGTAVTLTTPKRGEKHDLVILAEKNAADALEKRNAKSSVQYDRTIGACKKLGCILGLSKNNNTALSLENQDYAITDAEKLPVDSNYNTVHTAKLLEATEYYPRRIEGYDISNTQGTLSVASMVVFVDGKPAKKEYRRFRIKTVEGANDFASMNEVLCRRFSHGIEERAKLDETGTDYSLGKFSSFPDLILVDGGPVQLRFAKAALEELGVTVPIFGLAKREEEIYLPDREEPVCLDHHTPELQLVQRVRDEAHRFGITYHRQLRDKAFTHSQLDDIPGIGPKRRKALLSKFSSIKAIKNATEQELESVPGMNKAAVNSILEWQKKAK